MTESIRSCVIGRGGLIPLSFILIALSSERPMTTGRNRVPSFSRKMMICSLRVSSTLILLARVELLETFLAALNEGVVIPKQVQKECCEEKQSVDALLIRRLIQEKKILVQPVKDKRLYGKILADFPLGKGEAEALALAVSQKARLFATDDKRAIEASRLLKITFTTAIGILVRMYEKGVLEKDEALAKLESLRKYGRYKKEIIEDAKSRLEAK